ncbi:RDD family protein [[Mycobacterium] crassicus]|uniref:RDD family protein n=1 Tax=[Mycobacterium] crassicus TaxID=2872309 RepID=A0ABU5XGC9_9MYCO|nr:RDD family protein [Mycolicibacter sp. MYC098]MEB3020201.1 RDD family protein [Mycolicibacter sp. MYC098]
MTEAVIDVPAGAPATWRTRVIALGIDLLPGAVVVVTTAMAAMSFPSGGVWWWLAMTITGAVILATAVNRVLLPVITGWSLGRAFTGIEVVRGGEGSTPAVGAARLLLREVAHLLDTVPVFLGWLWPLRDRRGRTFADLVARTEVRPAVARQQPANIRTVTMAVFVAAAALSLCGAAAAYLVVFQREHNSDVARAEIARQGPKIVADMLSYDPATLDDDFGRAQSLATERYREQLVPQQDAIRNSQPAPNFYRVTDAAVLDATPHRATVLMFLQGQRGTAGKERLISATVRVVFTEAAGNWRVDDLSVVSKPLPAEGDK